MEMDVVLRVLLERVELLPTSDPDEPWKFKGVAWTPAGGGMARIERRRRGAAPPAASEVGAAA
jgi:cytochrome P450